MRFFDYSMSVCERYASDKEDAAEILNDGFMKIFQGLDIFNSKHDNAEADFRAWIRKVMVYTAIDRYRKNQRQVPTESINSGILDISNADETQVDKMSYKEILKCIHLLSPAYRTVFSLFVIDGFSHEEISRILEISVGTSKSNLSKAKLNLHKMMETHTQRISYERKIV